MSTTWDAANTSTAILLSRANTCAFGNTLVGTWKISRATSSASAGKLYLEMILGNVSNNGIIVGFANSSQVTSNYPGSSGNSFGYQTGTGSVYGLTGTWQAVSTNGSVVQVAIDLGAKLVWMRTDRSTSWNNSGTADPATGVGGKSYTVTGALYPVVGINGSSTNNANWAMLNTGAFTFSGSIPSGFSAWDSGAVTGTGIAGTHGPTTWDPSNQNSNIVLSNSNRTATQNSATNTWGIVYSTSKYDSGQVYFEATVTAYDGGNGIIFGLSDGSEGTANGKYPGIDYFDEGFGVGVNGIYLNTSTGSGQIGWQGAAVGNVIGVAVDFNRGLMWAKNLSTGTMFWNNDSVGDPVAGTRGAAIPPGDLYIAFAGNRVSGASDAITLNTGGTSFIGTIPTGYSAWDSVGGAVAAAVNSAVTVIT